MGICCVGTCLLSLSGIRQSCSTPRELLRALNPRDRCGAGISPPGEEAERVRVSPRCPDPPPFATASFIALWTCTSLFLPAHSGEAWALPPPEQSAPSSAGFTVILPGLAPPPPPLSATNAFRSLPLERPPIILRASAAKESRRRLQDLQDRRLEKCPERGTQWEQCFMFGDSDDSSAGGRENSSRRADPNDRPSPGEGRSRQRPPTW